MMHKPTTITLLALLLITTYWTLVTGATAQDALPSEVQTAKDKYQKMMDKNYDDWDEARKKLKTSFIKNLESAMEKQQKAGKLQETLALKKRIDAVKNATEFELNESDPDYASYKKKLDDIVEDKTKADLKDSKAYVSYLKKKVTAATKAGKLELAVAFDREMKGVKKIRLELTKNESPLTTMPKSHILPRKLKLGLILHYSFSKDDPEKVIDSSGQNTHGTMKAGAKWIKDGKVGGGCYFNGNNAYVLCNDTDKLNTSSITLSIWVKKARTSGPYEKFFSRNFFSDGRDHGAWTFYFSSSGALHFYGKTSYGNKKIEQHWLSTGIKPLPMEWNHFIYTCDGRNACVYVNKKLVTSKKLNFGKVFHTNYPLKIGADGDLKTTSCPFLGSIDEVMIWNRALKSSEIDTVFESQNGSIDKE